MKNLLLIALALCSLNAHAAKPNGKYYRLFTPLTFFHGVSGSQLSIASSDPDEVSQAINQALMNVYLKRPDLVRITETEQQHAGTLRQDIIDQEIVQTATVVEQADPMPSAPEVESVQVDVSKPNFWKFRGDSYLQFMQNYVSNNWYKGGESNYSAVGSLTLEANYDNKQKFKWENKLELKLGMQTSRSDSLHKFKAHEDLIRYTGKVGLQAAKRWYYTMQLLAYTQFTQGYRANDPKTYSDFMSPFNLSLGLGLDYKVSWLKGRITGTVNMSPLAINYRYVDRADLAGNFGVKLDRHTHSLTDFGSQLTASLEWRINDVVTWKTRLYSFSSFHREELEWENTFALRVSKYISANLFLFPRFDDNRQRDDELGYWQFKEYSSLGFSYNF